MKVRAGRAPSSPPSAWPGAAGHAAVSPAQHCSVWQVRASHTLGPCWHTYWAGRRVSWVGGGSQRPVRSAPESRLAPKGESCEDSKTPSLLFFPYFVPTYRANNTAGGSRSQVICIYIFLLLLLSKISRLCPTDFLVLNLLNFKLLLKEIHYHVTLCVNPDIN